MKKRAVIIIFYIFLIQHSLFSQEGQVVGVGTLDVPAKNSLRFNKFIINPAFSFVREDEAFINVYNKRQWSGFDNAPTTYFLSYSSRFGENRDNNNAYGLGIFQRSYGVLNTFGAVLNFSHNIVMSNENNNLTFGLNLSYINSGLNKGKIITGEVDPILQNTPSYSLVSINPGINLGLGMIDIGIAANNLFLYNFSSSEVASEDPGKNYALHVMYTGYTNQGGFFEKSKFGLLVRGEVYQDKTGFAGSILYNVPKAGWVQGGYNTLNGFSAGVGFNLAKKFSIGYNFEKPLGNFSSFGLTHEIVLAYKIRGFGDYEIEKPVIKAKPNKSQQEIAAIKETVRIQKEKEIQIKLVRDREEEDRLRKLAEEQRLARLKAEEEARILREQNKQLTNAEKAALAEAERIRLAQAEADRLAKIERERLEKIAADKERDRLAELERIRAQQSEKDRLAQIERDRLAQIEKDKQSTAEKARLAALEKQRLADVEKARLAQIEKDRLAQIEKDKQSTAEKARLAAFEKQRLADLEKARLAQIEKDRLAQIEKDKQSTAEKARLAALEKQRLADVEKARLAQIEKDRLAQLAADKEKDRLAALEKQRATDTEKARLAQIEKDRLAQLAADKEKDRLAALEKQRAADAEKARLAQIEKDKEAADAKAIADAQLAKTQKDREIEYIAQVASDAKRLRDIALEKLELQKNNLDKELKELKRQNDLIEQGGEVPTEIVEYKGTTQKAVNEEINRLKAEITKNAKDQEGFITQYQNALNEKLKETNKNDVLYQKYLKEAEALKADKLKADQLNADLLAQLESIKEATIVEKNRRIRRAVVESPEAKYAKDRAAFEKIRNTTIKSTKTFTSSDFDFGDEELPNNQIFKKLDNVKPGYYVVVASHKEPSKRDVFLTKALEAGERGIDFFYNVNLGRYFIFYKRFDSLEQVEEEKNSKGEKPYNAKMVIIKVEN
jgi:type IX secretion system PorP/SprF family membrane protein